MERKTTAEKLFEEVQNEDKFDLKLERKESGIIHFLESKIQKRETLSRKGILKNSED